MNFLKKNLHIIDPMHMSFEQQVVLQKFLMKNHFKNKVFPTSKIYSILHADPYDSSKIIDYRFQLANVIICKKQTASQEILTKNKEQIQFDIIEKKELGTDEPGALFFCKGTLIPLDKGGFYFKSVPNKYLKEQKYASRSLQDKIKKTMEMTYQNPISVEDFKSPITLHLLKGKKLLDIINEDLSAKAFKYHLTTDQRLQLSISLLRALKEQIHDYDIVHRDLQPDNILVNMETIGVYIIDFGLSKIVNTKPDIENVGHRYFSSPEQLQNEISTLESDLYSMGRILSLIWKFFPKNNIEEFYQDEMRFELTRLKEIDDLSDDIKNKIVNIIKEMTNMKIDDRYSLVDHIKFFEAIQFNRKYNDIIDEQLIDQLKLAHTAAIEARERLNKLSKSTGNVYDSFTAFEKIAEIIKSTLNLLDTTDNPLIYDEFIRTLGINAFNNVKTKQEIFDRLYQIEEDFYEKVTKLLQILDKLKKISVAKLSNDEKVIFENFLGEEVFYRGLFTHFTQEIESVLANINAKLKYMSIDDIVAFNQHVFSQIDLIIKIFPYRYEAIIGAPEANITKIVLPNVMYELLSKRESDSEEGNRELIQCQTYLKTAIAMYLRLESEKARQKLYAATSLKDVYDILIIINHSINADQLIENIKTHLASIKKNFWRRNKLEVYLNNAMKQYQLYKKKVQEPTDIVA